MVRQLCWLTLACAVLLVGCDTTASVKPNLVVIVIDTLRADHLGAWGYDRPTSPNLDALAGAGVRFANAHSTSSWILPSVASIFTGLYPATHGAERNNAALSDDLPLMAEAFRDAGYLTTAISANPAFVTPLQGFARGFDEFVVKHGAAFQARGQGDTTPADPWLQSVVGVSPADELTTAALQWIAGHDSVPAPYFLYLHYFDPHAGYFPPPEYATRFGVASDDPLRGAAQWPLLLTFQAPARAEDTATLVKLYDAEIAYVDHQVGALIAGIRARTTRPTYFVVLSDHGEEFDDHGGIQHGRTLYEELIRVPLIVAGPGIAPRVVERPVSLVSLWPTLAELLAVKGPPTRDGPSIAPLLRGEPTKDASLFADLEARFPRDQHVHRRAVIVDTWKMTMAPDRATRLFDLRADPREQRGTSDQENRRLMLNAILKSHDTATGRARSMQPPEKIELSRERAQQLKALGYLEE